MKTYTEKRFFEWHEDKVSVSLRASGASYGGGSEVLVMATGQANAEIMRGGCPTLTNNHEQPILLSDRKGHNGITEDGTATTLTAQEKERPIGVVRRLTPMECERLQGFPDGWTDIGEWWDRNGKKHKEADSPRYKALGNSISLPFWEWLARRIVAQYERPVTMGSLFDGISGFPLAFTRAGAKPIWASEIDEFSIAVSTAHFGDEDNYKHGDMDRIIERKEQGLW